jgi:hypothetical protein
MQANGPADIGCETEMTKQKEVSWHDKPLMSRIAAILYPGNTDQATRDQMQAISDANGKRSPQQVQQAIRDKR